MKRYRALAIPCYVMWLILKFIPVSRAGLSSLGMDGKSASQLARNISVIRWREREKTRDNGRVDFVTHVCRVEVDKRFENLGKCQEINFAFSWLPDPKKSRRDYSCINMSALNPFREDSLPFTCFASRGWCEVWKLKLSTIVHPDFASDSRVYSCKTQLCIPHSRTCERRTDLFSESHSRKVNNDKFPV